MTLAAPRASVGVTPKPVARRGGACRPANGNPTARGGDRVVAPDSARGSARGRCRPDCHVQVHPRATGLLGVASHRRVDRLDRAPVGRDRDRLPGQDVHGRHHRHERALQRGRRHRVRDRAAQDEGGRDASRSHRRHAGACRGRERLVQRPCRHRLRRYRRDIRHRYLHGHHVQRPGQRGGVDRRHVPGQGGERERPVPVRAEVRRDRPVGDRGGSRALGERRRLVQPARSGSMSRAPTARRGSRHARPEPTPGRIPPPPRSRAPAPTPRGTLRAATSR